MDELPGVGSKNFSRELSKEEKKELEEVLASSSTTRVILHGEGDDREITFYADSSKKMYKIRLDSRGRQKEADIDYPEYNIEK